MKYILLLYIAIILTALSSCASNGCDRDSKKYVNQGYYLNPVVLSYFPYSLNDTISYSLDGAPINNIAGTYLIDTIIETYRGLLIPDCGDYEVDQQEYRIIRFLKENQFGFFELKLTPYYEQLKLNFKFGSPVYQTYELEINSLKSITDTLTIDNILYTDVYNRIDTSSNTMIYYSKSKGLLKIRDKNITIFKIMAK